MTNVKGAKVVQLLQPETDVRGPDHNLHIEWHGTKAWIEGIVSVSVARQIMELLQVSSSL